MLIFYQCVNDPGKYYHPKHQVQYTRNTINEQDDPVAQSFAYIAGTHYFSYFSQYSLPKTDGKNNDAVV